ncbi:MAG: 3-isopropylmalate dehydrogenase [Salinivirgaceae bacterium]|jgi:3-isopropylmalate dehydrogenase|nr:3-isopropylmalate dehydrogenase [Salinivirgaceae bacterium]
MKNILVLPGDGIGPEITKEAIKVMEAAAKAFNFELNFDYGLIGASSIYEVGNPLPEETIQKAEKSDAILLGAVGVPELDGEKDPNRRPEMGLLGIRKAMELFCNIRPIKIYEAIKHLSPLKEEIVNGTDFVIFRELTGGIYFGKKGRSEDGQTAFDDCNYSVFEIKRIAKLAYEEAMRRDKKLLLADKANVLETSRLWRETVTEMNKDFPEVKLEYQFIDNAAMQVVMNPSQFSVVVTENMFGDILSDEASVIIGSLGMLPSASYGTKTALFEPSHGSYPQAAGKNIANPIATILSAALLLQYIGFNNAAKAIEISVDKALAAGIVTADINSDNASSTTQVGDFIAENVKKEAAVLA